jgi:hypothetical protein
MPDNSLYVKQLEPRSANEAEGLEETADNAAGGLDGTSRPDGGASLEWQRFYEVIKEITDDMRR